MGTVVFTSPRTLRVLGLQKLLFPFIFRRNVPLHILRRSDHLEEDEILKDALCFKLEENEGTLGG